MSMHITTETMAVLWLGAGAVALWMWLPAVLNALGLTFFQVSMDDDAAALEPCGSDAAYEELFAQLRCLGFVPVGRRSKTCWFFCHHWYRNFQARIFAVPQGDCIAVTFKLWPWDRWRLYFVTAFSDEAIVETANQMERVRIDEPDYLRWGLATPDRALLLERHREVCRSFAAGGSPLDLDGRVQRRSVAVLPVEEVNRLEHQNSCRYHRKRHRWTGLIVMSHSLWCLGLGLLLVLWLGDTAPYLLPVSVIAWGFLWPAVLACFLRAAAGYIQAEDARRQRNQQTPRRVDGGALQEQSIMSNEKNDEHAKNQSAKTRMRFKVTVVCVGMIMAAVACAIKMYSGDPHFTVVQTALLTYLALVIAGFFLDLIIFRSK